jgi:aconitate hydratase 2 / 2-methylisocitrate dehydratase
MVARGYTDARTMLRRVAQMEAWLANPVLMSADADAEYAEIIEIDLNTIFEDEGRTVSVDDVRKLAEV